MVSYALALVTSLRISFVLIVFRLEILTKNPVSQIVESMMLIGTGLNTSLGIRE
jgi:hypothetical protein